MNYKFVAGILATALAYDAVVGCLNISRFNKLKEQNKELREEALKYHSVATYYADKLDQNDIPLTEFDRIAIKTVME